MKDFLDEAAFITCCQHLQKDADAMVCSLPSGSLMGIPSPEGQLLSPSQSKLLSWSNFLCYIGPFRVA